jgi:nucleotide-binding universal stress UspA family protein
MLVMGSCGRTGLVALVKGSVGQVLINHAEVPVAVVRSGQHAVLGEVVNRL